MEFSDLDAVTPDTRDLIRRAGCVIIRNIVDDKQALAWKTQLAEYVKLNPSVGGIPEHNKQLFML